MNCFCAPDTISFIFGFQNISSAAKAAQVANHDGIADVAPSATASASNARLNASSL